MRDQREIVEAADGYVRRHVQPHRLGFEQRPHSQNVVAADHGRGPCRRGHQHPHRVAPFRNLVSPLDEPSRRQFDAPIRQCIADTGDTVLRPFILHAVSRDHRDIAMTDFEQIAGQPVGCKLVVETDRRMQAVRVIVPGGDVGQILSADQLEHLFPLALTDQH